MPQKGFGSAVCEQRNREIVHIVSETADLIPFRGTPHRKFKAPTAQFGNFLKLQWI